MTTLISDGKTEYHRPDESAPLTTLGSRQSESNNFGEPKTSASRTRQIALVGNPNAGKSTLFNLMTGSHAKVMNAPGTTVELQRGSWRDNHGTAIEVVDLPGTYSLLARSPDEQVTTSFLRDGTDLIIVILDATALARSLYLLSQVLDMGVPVIAVVTMLDVAATRGVNPDLHALADALKMPVVALDPRSGTGMAAFNAAINRQIQLSEKCNQEHVQPPAEIDVGWARFQAAGKYFSTLSANAKLTNCNCDTTPITAALESPEAFSQPAEAAASKRFAWTEQVLAAALPAAPTLPVRSFSDRLDRLLLHPIFGLPMFGLVLWLVFQLTTTVATPLVDAISAFFDGPLSRAVMAITPDGSWLQSLLINGIITGVGTVLSFTPLLALVFLGITILEDSGYLARAAYVADRALRKLGLDGRAMVPLVIGFGCNVPAIVATKTIPDARRRLLTGLLVPLTSCPAMLTIYVLVAAAFFPGQVGSVIFAMYALSAILVVLIGLILHATVFKGLGSTQPLVLALPAYRFPKLKFIAQTCVTRVFDFIKGAGGVIAGALVVAWLLSAIPMPGATITAASDAPAAALEPTSITAIPGSALAPANPSETSGSAQDSPATRPQFGQVPISDSLYGRAASLVSPLLAPAGLDDWRITSAIATGFIAKEATVGALAQTLGSVEPGAEARADNWLAEQFHATLAHSSGGYPTAAAAAFLVLVLANTPCLATAATQRRAFGWRWALASVVGQMMLAWALAVLTFQIFRLVV